MKTLALKHDFFFACDTQVIGNKRATAGFLIE